MWRMVSRGAECEGYEVPGPNIPGPDSCRDAGTKSPPATDPAPGIVIWARAENNPRRTVWRRSGHLPALVAVIGSP